VPDRSLQLARTFRGAGKLHGDLTPQCAAALAAVLEALGKRAEPEDLRSKWQRDHDALEEACAPCIVLWDVTGRGKDHAWAGLIAARFTSKQLLEVRHRHAGVGQNATKGSFGDISSTMYWHSSPATVRMAHDVVAADYPRDLESGLF
jgi:Domain of unknown function (DUF222)